MVSAGVFIEWWRFGLPVGSGEYWVHPLFAFLGLALQGTNCTCGPCDLDNRLDEYLAYRILLVSFAVPYLQQAGETTEAYPAGPSSGVPTSGETMQRSGAARRSRWRPKGAWRVIPSFGGSSGSFFP